MTVGTPATNASYDFNSTIVRLKASVAYRGARHLQDFNSTIVRLKGKRHGA